MQNLLSLESATADQPRLATGASRSATSLARLNPTLEDIQRLIAGEVLALRYPNFCLPEACEVIADRLINHPRGGFYSNAPQIGRVGKAYFEAIDETSKADYYDQAPKAIEEVRSACEPYYPPMDKLRNVLDDIWPASACREAIEGKKMYVGLTRIFTPGKEGALPHQDVLAWDAPADCQPAQELLLQLACNVYVRPADAGGELELWRTSLSLAEYRAKQLPGSYGLDRSRLPEPAEIIRPQIGELVIFNANKTHAVRPVEAGVRVTVSCFVGVRGFTKPLGYWS